MGTITRTFGKKCYSVTTPGDNLQISSTKRAFIECMFLPRRLRSDWLPTSIPVRETRSQQSARAACTQCSAWRCCVALFDVNKPAPVAAVQWKSDKTCMTTESRKPGVFVKTAHRNNNNNDNKKNDDSNNNDNGVGVGGEFRWGDLSIFIWEKKNRIQNSVEWIWVTAIQALS